MKLISRRRASCIRHCHSATDRTFCLVRCLVKATPAHHPTVAGSGPAVSAGSPWKSFLPKASDCRANPGDKAGPACDNTGRRPVTGADSVQSVDGWLSSPQVSVVGTHEASKRGYNDVVDLCIAYNCPRVAPGSLDFMRCIRQFHCM